MLTVLQEEVRLKRVLHRAAVVYWALYPACSPGGGGEGELLPELRYLRSQH